MKIKTCQYGGTRIELPPCYNRARHTLITKVMEMGAPRRSRKILLCDIHFHAVRSVEKPIAFTDVDEEVIIDLNTPNRQIFRFASSNFTMEFKYRENRI